MRKLFFLLSVSSCLLLTACSTVMEYIPGVYTLDIQQGNMVDQDMIDQLKPNMTKRQVLYIMGSPMLIDAFHQKRWEYLYSKQVADVREQKRISLYFDGDILVGVQGDFRPDSQGTKNVKETTLELPPRDLEKTLLEKVAGLLVSEPERKVQDSKPDEGDKAKTEPVTKAKTDAVTVEQKTRP